MPPLISKEEMNATFSGNESDAEPIYTEILEYICDGSHSHPSVNRIEDFSGTSYQRPDKKYGESTNPFKLATGTKPSVSHLRVLFCQYFVWKATAHVGKKALNMRHQAQKVFAVSSLELHSIKRVSCVRTTHTEDNIFS